MTVARLGHEYEYSIRQAKFTRGGSRALPISAVESGMVKISPKHWEAMGLREEPVLTGPNTMVISNNFGFHRRGYFKPGTLVFHYLEEPAYATLI